MTTGRLFWAVILGVITILLADLFGTVLKSRAGYRKVVTALGGSTSE
jgi:hypothetical protein